MQSGNAEKISRRQAMRRMTVAGSYAAGVLATGWPTSHGYGGAAAGEKKRIAAINSIYRLRSHAYHICGRFIHGFERDGFHHQPNYRVARMFNHQTPANDLSTAHSELYGIEISRGVAAALGAPEIGAPEKGGPGKIDVDAVLLIIEHGEYPVNEHGQVLYPRYELFEEIVAAFRAAGRSVPVFVDKHLSHDFAKAAQMLNTARELKFGLMAGSSLPVTWRIPEIEPPIGTPFTEAVVAFGFDRGAPDIYFFHALEVLQCMLERRSGGESGVRSVECLRGADVWKAADAGRFSWRLVEEAVRRCPSNNVGPIRENVLQPQAICVEYRDGVRGTVINLIEQVSEFGFAATVRDQPTLCSTLFHLPPPPGARFFDPLVYHIEQFFETGVPSYPVERTLLTSTILDIALRNQTGKAPIEHQALDVRYQPPASSGFFRG